MKTIGLSFLFYFNLFISVQAQENILYRDQFNNNQNNWDLYDNEYASASIGGGSFNIQFKYTSSWWSFLNYLYLDPSEDFYIETEMTHKSGVVGHGYGLIWGARSWADSYHFIISTSGYFAIYGYKKEEYFSIQDWKACDKIKATGVPNRIAIRKKEGRWHFYINGEWVHSIAARQPFGAYLGFVLNENMSVSVNYLLVKHPPIQINLVENPVTELKEHLGRTINSEYTDIAPVISPDGKTLYFACEGHPANVGKEKKCDIWYSELQADGTWGEKKHADKPLNNAGINVVISVSPDGNTLLLEGLYNADGTHKSENGISRTHRTTDGWTVPEEVKIVDFHNYNEYETYCPSIDGSVLILSVERRDSYGDTDLYVSFRQDNGEYSKPKNMGTTLNTYDGDGTPFLAADNRTLYFFSYGHPGYGSADIFVTRRLDDTWTNWTEPQNLGTAINSKEWDTYYTIPASGDYAYLVSHDNTFGVEDISRIRLNASAKPDPVVLIYGKVLDAETKQPIEAKIHYDDLARSVEAGVGNSHPTDGTYKIVVPYGSVYGIRVYSDNYFFMGETLSISEKNEYTEIEKDIYLTPLQNGNTIRLNHIDFAKGKSELQPQSKAELERIVQFMNNYPAVEVEIGGHTELSHDDPQLSQDRANAVRNYLIEKGVRGERVTAVGYANRQPLETELSGDSQWINRRVELKIVKK